MIVNTPLKCLNNSSAYLLDLKIALLFSGLFYKLDFKESEFISLAL